MGVLCDVSERSDFGARLRRVQNAGRTPAGRRRHAKLVCGKVARLQWEQRTQGFALLVVVVVALVADLEVDLEANFCKDDWCCQNRTAASSSTPLKVPT
jgi:hypothetical protein